MNRQRSGENLPGLQVSGRISLLVCGFLAAGVFHGACVFTLLTLGNGEHSIFQAASSQLSEGWTDSEGKAVTLPAKLPYPQDGAYNLYAVLPAQDIAAQDMSLLFSAKYLNGAKAYPV